MPGEPEQTPVESCPETTVLRVARLVFRSNDIFVLDLVVVLGDLPLKGPKTPSSVIAAAQAGIQFQQDGYVDTSMSVVVEIDRENDQIKGDARTVNRGRYRLLY